VLGFLLADETFRVGSALQVSKVSQGARRRRSGDLISRTPRTNGGPESDLSRRRR